MGRPVGVALDRQGALLVADDVGNVIWRVTAAGGSGPQSAFPPAAGAASAPASLLTGVRSTGVRVHGHPVHGNPVRRGLDTALAPRDNPIGSAAGARSPCVMFNTLGRLFRTSPASRAANDDAAPSPFDHAQRRFVEGVLDRGRTPAVPPAAAP